MSSLMNISGFSAPSCQQVLPSRIVLARCCLPEAVVVVMLHLRRVVPTSITLSRRNSFIAADVQGVLKSSIYYIYYSRVSSASTSAHIFSIPISSSHSHQQPRLCRILRYPLTLAQYIQCPKPITLSQLWSSRISRPHGF